MAELLVRVFDKYTGSDPITKSKNTVRGDVIAIQDDGAYWGPCEIKNPAYIIFSIPVSMTEAEAMLAPEQGDPVVKRTLQRRAFKLEVDLFLDIGRSIPSENDAREARYPSGVDSLDYLKGPDRPIIDIPASAFRAAKAQKNPIEDPMVVH